MGLIPGQGTKILHATQCGQKLKNKVMGKNFRLLEKLQKILQRFIFILHPDSSEFSSVQFSLFQLFATPWTAARQASLSITNSWSLLKLMSIESVMSSTISSFVVRFSSCLQSFPASGSFPMSQFFASGGQSIGASASAYC